MSRKPTLSPTKISTYFACPVKYRWTYVDGRGRFYLRAKSYYSFGSSLHRVLQRFHDSSDSGVESVHQALAATEESWIDAGYSSSQEMQEALGEGKAIIEAYVQRVKLEPTKAKTILVEKLLRKDMGSFSLIGRIDRVDQHEDGSLEIIDYKSGRLDVSNEEVKHDLAMNCYQLLLRDLYPDARITASILALRTCKKAASFLDEMELAQFQEDLTRSGQEIISREFETIPPMKKPICEGCDFIQLCRKHELFER